MLVIDQLPDNVIEKKWAMYSFVKNNYPFLLSEKAKKQLLSATNKIKINNKLIPPYLLFKRLFLAYRYLSASATIFK